MQQNPPFPITARVTRLLLLALLLAGSAVLLLVLLRGPAAWMVDVGQPGDSLVLHGFFAVERDETGRDFRWSGLQSRLVLHGAHETPSILSLHMHGDLLINQADPHLRLLREGHPIATIAVQPQWRTYRVLLPAGAAVDQTGAAVPLDLTVAAYCPTSTDNRVLGAPLDWLRLTPAAGAPLPVLVPLRHTLLLTWGLALLAGLLWLREHRRHPDAALRGFVARVGAPVALAAGGLALWAELQPHPLAWLLAFAPWVLAAATLALVVGAAPEWWRRQAARLATLLRPAAVGLVPLLFGLAHVVLLAPLPPDWRGTAAWVLLLLPGVLLAVLLFRHQSDPPLLAFLGLCGGLTLLVLLMLPLHLLPGAPPWWLLLLACDLLSVALLLVLLRAPRPPRADAPPLAMGRWPWALLLVLLLAAGLRLPFLGGAEFQGDEARALLLAMEVQQGRDDILLFHRKGPVEALLPAAPLVLTGQVTEWTARLPFALAGLGTVLGGFVLARRLLGGTTGIATGLLAAVLLATDGFMIAFSRIVQYQGILVLLGAGALWCAWRFFEGSAHPRRYLLGAAVLAAVGLLAHYDGIYVLPALAWLVLAGGWRHGWRGWQWARGLAAPLLAGGALVLGFYVPFFSHHQFSGTIDYLSERVNAEYITSITFNNLPDHYNRLIFYNTTVQIQWLAIILAAGVVAWLLCYARPRVLGLLLAGLLLAGIGVLLLAPEQFQTGPYFNAALLALGLPLLVLALFPATPPALRTLVIWCSLPFIAHAFFIADPRTHFYTMHVPTALLIALAVVRLLEWLRARRLAWLQVPLAVGGAAMLLIAVPYLYIIYIQQMPEYQRAFPLARPAFYRDLSSDSVPWEGIFGFPHRDGWKAVGERYQRGTWQGSYHSNQRDRISIWYTRGAARCFRQPEYYFLATWNGANLEEKMEPEQQPEDYQRSACVLVDGMRMMDIYQREPLPTPDAPPEVIWLADYAAAFDARPVEEDFPLQQALNVPLPQHRLAVAWPGGVHLTGYDLPLARLAVGQTGTLTLYWRLAQSPDPVYDLVVDVYDSEGQRVAQTTTLCGAADPQTWSTALLNRRTVAFPAETRLESGMYTLRASLRHTRTGAVLPLQDGARRVPLARFVVEETP